MEKMNEIVLFEAEDKSVTLSVPVDQETVWLTQEQMSELYEIKQPTKQKLKSFVFV